MANLGAVHENKDPKDYKYYFEWTSGTTDDDGTLLWVNADWRLTWGKEFSDTVTGIKATLYQSHVGSTEVFEFKFYTPAGGAPVYTDTGTTWDGDLPYHIELDGLYLTRTGCDYELGWDELRLYLDTTLLYTEGAYVETGSDYDRRLNVIYSGVDAGGGLLPDEPGRLPLSPIVQDACTYVEPVFTWANDCGGLTFDEYVTYNHESTIQCETWFEWYEPDDTSWHHDSIWTKPYTFGSCDCEGPDPYWAVVTHWHVKHSATFHEWKEKVLGESDTCYCDDGYQTATYYYVTEYSEHRSACVTITPSTSNLRWDTETYDTNCSGTHTSGSDHTYEDLTYIQVDASAAHYEVETPCMWISDQTGCMGEPTEPPPPEAGTLPNPFPCNHGLHYVTECCQYKSYLLEWDYAPCSTGSVSYDVSHGLIHFRAYIASGTVWVGRSGNDLIWTDTDTSITGDWVSIRMDRKSRGQQLVLLIEDAGTITQYLSNDGTAWTMSTTIATGTKPAHVVGIGGLRYIYWIDGTDIKGMIRGADNALIKSAFTAVTGVDDSGVAVDESFLHGGDWRIVLHCVVGGTITQYVSDDGVTFS